MAERTNIEVRGAREHNLDNVDVDIPRGKLVVMCGVSGSGKSTLAFDTIYAEGQRRYVESLSAYARQFLGQLKKPDVDSIEGLSPAVAIDQKTTNANPRSTVGTVTEIHDHLRLLFARVGTPHCPNDGARLGSVNIAETAERLVATQIGETIIIGCHHTRAKKGTMVPEIEAITKQGFSRVRIDGRVVTVDDPGVFEKNLRHDIDIIVDRLKIKDSSLSRITDSIVSALAAGGGEAFWERLDGEGNTLERTLLSRSGACGECGTSWPKVEPRTFSFNSPFGACSECDGLGVLLRGEESLIVPNPERSLIENAIAPWAGMHGSYQRWTLEAMCAQEGISRSVSWRKLNAAAKRKILDGVEGTVTARHGGRTYQVRYEGVRGYLEKKMNDGSSDKTREAMLSYMREKPCDSCGGGRLSPYALSVRVGESNIWEIEQLQITEALKWFEDLKLTQKQSVIAERLIKETKARLGFLSNVGLGYITLERSARTLSGGEAQRIRLASQIGAGLAGVLYVLDEPSIGLHPQDNERLISTLKNLRDLGNTVLVVEHDEDTVSAADWVIDVGPGAGRHGGKIVAEGTPQEIKENPNSVTGPWIAGRKRISIPEKRRERTGEIKLTGVSANNIKNIDVTVPLGVMTGVCGVSGSGKSTLVNDVLEPAAVAGVSKGAKNSPGVKKIKGLSNLDKVINIDQSPIGRTPRSNPATYTGVFDKIRSLYGELPESKARGWKQGRYSFNVPSSNGGGRCETCDGDGVITVTMNFLPDVYVPCETCDGSRYNKETLEVKYRGKSIADVLAMTVDEAREHFKAQSGIKRILDTLSDVGLGYVMLGHSATWLSGGEAQRVKIAEQLCKRNTGKTFYILDEPTTGLHFEDVAKLLEVLERLVSGGNTVLIVEHNTDVLSACDWLIELGPNGGDGGGEIVAEGTPEHVGGLKTATGRFLSRHLEREPSTHLEAPVRRNQAKRESSTRSKRAKP